MKIGLKILLGYLLVLVVVVAALSAALPRIIDRGLQDHAGITLKEQAWWVGRKLAEQPSPEGLMRSYENIVNADLLVTDEQGRVLYEARRERAAIPSLKNTTLPHALIDRGLIAPPLQYFRAGNLFGRQAVIAGVSPLIQRGRITGVVVAVRAFSEQSRTTQAVTRELLLWLGLGLAAAVLLSGLLTQGIVRRLRRTGGAARALAEGDLNQRAPETGGDEIAELGRRFNHMAERIQVLVEGLQRSENLRRELMASISHELRTPITSILGFAEALRDGVVKDPAQQQRYYQIIARDAARLSRQVQDLFDFTKMEAGQLEFKLVPLDPRPWLQEFAEGAGADLERDGLLLQLQGDPGESPITGDRHRLDQVLTNLVNNAARYTPPGGTITLTATPSDAGLRLEVADEGPGIPPEELPHIFERFYQGKNPGKQAGGAGLGLAIVKSIVEAHGGEVGVTSSLGQGARFWFTLHRAHTDDPE